MNICLFAGEEVGFEILKIFLNNNFKLMFLILDINGDKKLNENMTRASKLSKDNILYSDVINDNKTIKMLNDSNIDLSVLGWWHYMIKEPLIHIAKLGFLNLHPSFLPYNRGKHYYFWNIVESVPFGVSIHFIDKNIDSGDIVFQKEIKTTFLDTGFSLRKKSQIEIIRLFNDHFHDIVNGNFNRKKQNLDNGGFHLANELEKASEINLNKLYSGLELLNLLRAHSGFAKGGCHFFDKNKKFEISIKEA